MRFKAEHFDLLHKWGKKKRVKDDPEQDAAYDELVHAYAVTKVWAERVRDLRFPQGKVKIRRRPTNQANNFFPYNWARIYPGTTSPKALAYTVGIAAEFEGGCFVVKIDTVQAGNGKLRRKYEELRGEEYKSSGIVALLAREAGLKMTIEELAAWTVEQFDKFEYSYEEVAAALGLETGSPSTSMKPTKRDPSDALDPSPEAQNGRSVGNARNTIFYGPPGTGKTYQILQLMKDEYTSTPSSMLPEEWRKGQVAAMIPGLPWWKVILAALHDLDEPVDVPTLSAHPFLTARAGGIKPKNSTLWAVLQSHAVHDSTTVNVANRSQPGVFDKMEASEWSLAGDWAEECEDVTEWVDQYNSGPGTVSPPIKRFEFVTFHQSYGYEEFIEGLRPILDTDQIAYEISPGAFLSLCKKAEADLNHRYAMVIDEINRGNVSKIFGELITLIEPDKRLDAENEVTVLLPYSKLPFRVPPNVDILGSMNTSDRSLALLDTALRRRFDFVAIMPDPSLLTDIPVESDGVIIDLCEMLSAMNMRLEALFDRDHTIGHAFFMPLQKLPMAKRFDALCQIMLQKVVPLLEEFFFDDWDKIRLVLGDNKKSDPELRFLKEATSQSYIEDLFGEVEGQALDGLRAAYTLSPEAFKSPQAYPGIYAATSQAAPKLP